MKRCPERLLTITKEYKCWLWGVRYLSTFAVLLVNVVRSV